MTHFYNTTIAVVVELQKIKSNGQEAISSGIRAALHYKLTEFSSSLVDALVKRDPTLSLEASGTPIKRRNCLSSLAVSAS